MIEDMTIPGILIGIIGAMAGLYYKIGKIEQKINLIYDNIKIVLQFKENNNR